MPSIRYGDRVSPEVKIIYDRGLKFLAKTQQADGSWAGGQVGGGVTGLCMMAFLASGEDPNSGEYSVNIRRAITNIIRSQDSRTGFIPNSMYHHGFAMLSLAEAMERWMKVCWRTTDSAGSDRSAKRWNLPYVPPSPLKRTIKWVAGAIDRRRPIPTLRFRVPYWWDYWPPVMWIEVPDAVIDRALQYFRTSTSDTGMVAYSGGIGGFGESMNRSSIGTLVLAIGKRKNWSQFKATTEHIVTRLDHQESGHPFYFRYDCLKRRFKPTSTPGPSGSGRTR